MKTEERIAELKQFGYSPDGEGFPNPDVEWLVAELERARAALTSLRKTALYEAKHGSLRIINAGESVWTDHVIYMCNKGLGE